MKFGTVLSGNDSVCAFTMQEKKFLAEKGWTK